MNLGFSGTVVLVLEQCLLTKFEFKFRGPIFRIPEEQKKFFVLRKTGSENLRIQIIFAAWLHHQQVIRNLFFLGGNLSFCSLSGVCLYMHLVAPLSLRWIYANGRAMCPGADGNEEKVVLYRVKFPQYSLKSLKQLYSYNWGNTGKWFDVLKRVRTVEMGLNK